MSENTASNPTERMVVGGPRTLPLSGVRILDLSRLLPGPWATMLLSDYGAEVIKVEEPTRGDYSRWSNPRYGRESVYFSSANRNKRSIVIDLSRERGRDVLYRLAARADIVVESFRPGVADRLEVGYEALKEVNPRIIYCAITGFGQSGPYKDHAGHDLNIAGVSGFLNHNPTEAPRVSGLQMADFAGASMAVVAVLLALRDRDLSGCGQYLDVAMFDSLTSWLTILGTSEMARCAGYDGEPVLEAFGRNPRYAIYQTADGQFLSVSLLERSFWEKFCLAVDREDLINPNETESDRLGDHGELGEKYREALVAIFAQRSRDTWVTYLLAQGIPCFPVYTPQEVFSDSQFLDRGMLEWVNHPTDGRVPQLGFPIKSSKMKPEITSASPTHGQHSEEILSELGYTADEICQIKDEFDRKDSSPT